jgi:hypothetical protein
MTQHPDAPPPLQFDTVVPGGAPSGTADAAAGVTCGSCQRAIADAYYDVNGQPVCRACRGAIAAQAETPRGLGVLARAGFFGLVAAILGAVLYYAVIAITNFEIGLVAIAIGYMVGYAVRVATAGRGGLRFQVLAVVLTYWAVGLAYTPLVISQLADEPAEEAQIELDPAAPSAAPAQVTPAEAVPAAAVTEADVEEPAGPPNLPLAVAFMLALSLALPVLTVFGSLPSGLISAAIIAFGMLQAWRMTGVPAL